MRRGLHEEPQKVIVPDTQEYRPERQEEKMIDESIFKAYDIRGVYPDSLNEGVARDMRLSGEALEEAFIDGVTEAGADVLDLGLVSTDALYFAVGHLEEPGGAMITASHNPKDYNGFKLCREDAIALSGEQGIGQIRDLITSGKLPEPAEYPGSVEESDITEKLPFDYVSMYFELDGSFPNHPPNPIEPENMEELQERVKSEGADFGVAFDGDADRCFVVDEKGVTISGDLLAALVAKNILEKEPGATILYSAVCSKAFPELVASEGGRAIRTKAGHSIIKPQMREYDAAFGGEHSGHFYFRDNYFADSGIIALLTVAELVARQEGALSDLLAPIDPYVRSGEINSEVEDQEATLKKVEEHHLRRGDPKIDHLDGLTVDYGDWWFNLRPSNTEPLLRLNVEAGDRETMQRERDELLDLIRE